MPSPNATPTPVTPPRVPLIDPRTGLIDRAWYMFFLSMFNAASLVYDGDFSPSAESLIASYDAALQALAQNVDTQPLPVDLSAELTKQIEAAGLANYATGLLSQIAEMQKQLDALNLLPAPLPGPITSGTSLLYGDGLGGFSNATTGSGVSFVAGVLSATGSGGTITSVTATAPIASSGGFTPNISINAAYGDTVNPYAAKTANYVLAGPTSGAAAVPVFRTLVAADIPSLSYVTSVSGTSPVVSSGGTTPAISMPAATTSVNGYLTSTDWNTFNNKGSGTVTSVTGTAPVVSSGGATPAISMAAATTSVSGYLTSTDWNTFNGKGSGTVTSVAVSGGTTGLTTSGGPITTSGTITLAGTLAAANGGTGQSAYAVGDILYASTTSALSKLADVATGNALISGGINVAPSYGKIGLTTHVSGTLPTANGGTNLTSFTANGVVYASSSSVLATGSTLVFDGTKFGINVTPVAGTDAKLQITGGTTNVTTLATSYSAASVVVVPKSTSGYSLAIASGTGDLPQLQVSANGAASGDLLIQPYGGNVGIGTSSPQAKLAVSNAGAAGLEFFANAPGGGTGTYIQSYNRSGAAYVDTYYYAASHTWRTNASATSMTLASTGIVTMSAYGAGTATFSAAGVISSVSDETWKIKDGAPVDADAMLKKLEPGYWYYNDEKKEIFGKDRQLGFYAQNVNAAIGPEAAPEPKEGKPWGYYDRSVLAVVVMSLQKALDTIDSLTARIAALEQK